MIELIKEICVFRQNHPSIKGNKILVRDPKLINVKNHLLDLKNSLSLKFQNFHGINFEFVESKGEGFFPNVLHVSILPPNQRVSDGIYVVICFDVLGRGILVGCAESKTNPKGLTTIKRSVNKDLLIDVNGGRPTTKYNDVFVNPKEFLVNSIEEEALHTHIEESLLYCLYYLGILDEKLLSFKNRVNLSNSTFEPENLEDARNKTLKFITARRGQQKFRNQLLAAYKNKCAISGCNVTEVLEAAHIVPYSGNKTNTLSNGILLRADIHTLFDLGLLTIDAKTNRVKIAVSLKGSAYEQYLDQFIPFSTDVTRSLKYHNENIFQK
ncbi:HNH endonuclease [Priestia sp. BR_2]